ncbi:MAG: DUF1566 domain-containing protein [Gammaproteobacteria bacterium]|nr:DUF1566 domain-containing protein [Gammaproteobacteria bacterium]
MRFIKFGAMCIGILLATLTAVNAALVTRLGGQAIYDTDLNVTWLADSNLAASNSFGVAGINPAAGGYAAGSMTWFTAQDWLSAMNTSDGGAGYLGFSDWRLPATVQPDASCSIQAPSGASYGYNCKGSEMGHLFYVEENGVANGSGLFSNVQGTYWSDTWSINPQYAWHFDGFQNTDSKDNSYYVRVARSGDIAAVPVPAALWLFGSGLLGLVSMARGSRQRVG